MTLSVEELGIRVVLISCTWLEYPNYLIIFLLTQPRGNCVNIWCCNWEIQVLYGIWTRILTTAMCCHWATTPLFIGSFFFRLVSTHAWVETNLRKNVPMPGLCGVTECATPPGWYGEGRHWPRGKLCTTHHECQPTLLKRMRPVVAMSLAGVNLTGAFHISWPPKFKILK